MACDPTVATWLGRLLESAKCWIKTKRRQSPFRSLRKEVDGLARAVFLCVLIASVPARAQKRSLGAIGAGDEDIHITEIIPGSPAQKAGLAVGDILTTIDGEPSWTNLFTGKFELTTSKEAGSRLLVSYLREGKQGTATLIVLAPARTTVNREQTTLFGITLGSADAAVVQRLATCRHTRLLGGSYPVDWPHAYCSGAGRKC